MCVALWRLRLMLVLSEDRDPRAPSSCATTMATTVCDQNGCDEPRQRPSGSELVCGVWCTAAHDAACFSFGLIRFATLCGRRGPSGSDSPPSACVAGGALILGLVRHLSCLPSGCLRELSLTPSRA